jgi:hypothetical protein
MCVYLEEVSDWVSCEPQFHYTNGDMEEYFASTGYVPQDIEEPEPFCFLTPPEDQDEIEPF